MIRRAAVAILFAAIPAALAAQNKPRTLHLEGPQAERLISLLVTGSDSIASSLRDSGASRILLRDLMVMKYSTYKYDQDSAMYRLDVYDAHATIAGASQPTPIHEASALYAFLSSLGAKPDLSMQGSDLNADIVDCRIDTHAPFEKPQRFACDLTLPF
jgi:hypothetical protein